MRLSRFAQKVSQPDSKSRVGFAQALMFDVSQPENEDEAAIAEQRVAALLHVPVLLGTAHVLAHTCMHTQAPPLRRRGWHAQVSREQVMVRH